jgi:Tfp pilus assembly protein PilZ
MTNQRKHERYNLQLAVYLKDRRGANTVKTGNISKYGLFIVTPDPKPVRQLVQLVIEFPHKAEVINVLAQVMWVDETGTSERSGGQAGMGVKFFSIPDQERQKWEAFVDQVRTGRVRPDETLSAAPTEESDPQGVYTIGEEELEELEELNLDNITDSIEEEILSIEEEESAEQFSGDLSEAEAEYERNGAAAIETGAVYVSDDNERREYPRKPVSFAVKMRDLDAMRQFLTRDISLGGMFLKTTIEKKVGEIVDVLIVHPWTENEFSLRSEVRRIERNEIGSLAGLGVEFSKVDDMLRDSLLMFIESGYVVEKMDEDSPIESAVIQRIEVVEKQIKSDPINAALHFEVGLLYLGLSDWEHALEHVDISQKLGYDVPEEVIARLHQKVA